MDSNTSRIQSWARGRLNIYVHIPFCRQICGFCNLYTTKDRDPVVQDLYVEAVRNQIRQYAKLVDSDVEIPTFYFGGGTPTALSTDALNSIVTTARDHLNITNTTELAIEADPQTVDRNALRRLGDSGFRRISFGFQSRAMNEIKILGRKTTQECQDLSVEEALAAGFTNVCVDLIFGLPGQSSDSWVTSVQECIRLKPQTICCY